MKEYYISELMNIIMFVDEPSELPECVKSLNEEELHKLCIVVAAKDVYWDIDLPELIRNLNNYGVDFSIHNYYDLGRFWIENVVTYEGKASEYFCYIDFKRLGKDLCADGMGTLTLYGILWERLVIL